MFLTSLVEFPPSALNTNPLNLVVISSMLAKSKLSIVTLLSGEGEVSSIEPDVFVLNTFRERLPSLCSGNRSTRQSGFSTIVATTRYFPHSGIRSDSIPGNALLREFWEFSSVKSNTNLSMDDTFNPCKISSYFAYSSSSFMIVFLDF